jgi:hypothetical protein
MGSAAHQTTDVEGEDEGKSIVAVTNDEVGVYLELIKRRLLGGWAVECSSASTGGATHALTGVSVRLPKSRPGPTLPSVPQNMSRAPTRDHRARNACKLDLDLKDWHIDSM